jgi:glycosyltransferase involved in cell wall biosynthesis
MDPRKGVHVAVEAMEHLPEEATLTVQGGGDEEYLATIKSQVERLGLGHRVSFTRQPREQLPKIYAEADAVLFPVQWEEPWGLVPLEAMAVGRPVVATGTGGSAEYLKDGANCLIFEPRDSGRALAERIVRLASDPALRATLRDGGLETADKFTEPAYNERIRAALLQVATSRRSTDDV